MLNSILLTFHITGGTIGILTGMVSLIARKGSGFHRKVGNIFFYSMLCMTLSAAYLAMFYEGSKINTAIALLTFYMIVTARSTALNSSGKTGWPELAGMCFVFCLIITIVIFTQEVLKSENGHLGDGIPTGAYFFFGSIASLAFLLDLRVVLRGGIYGAQRIARHLWRMCFALFVATGSLFLGQPQVFPKVIRDPAILGLPVIIVVAALLFWLIRVYIKGRFKTVTSK